MAKSKDSQSYMVGYGKPPKHSQFSKGKSGNPNGRPKGSRSIATVLNQVLNEKVIMQENGRRKKITKLDASLKQVVNCAAKGNIAYLRLLIQLVPSLDSLLNDDLPRPLTTEEDMRILKNFAKRLKLMPDTGHREENN